MTSDPPAASAAVHDFHFGTAVYSDDGARVGSLRRLIIDGESLDIHGVVIKETGRVRGVLIGGRGLIEDDIAVPLRMVARADARRVDLTLSASQLRRVPPFITYRIDQSRASDPWKAYLMPGFTPPILERHHLAAGELEVTTEEAVRSGAGEDLGSVRDVLLDQGELVGIVLAPRGWFAADLVVPTRFLTRAEDLALVVTLSRDQLSQLAVFTRGE